MDYEDMIEDEPQPEMEGPEEELELEPVEPKAKSPWKAFILTGLLAGLIGAAGGGFGAYTALEKFSSAPAPQAAVDLSPIEARLNTLSDRMTEAEAEALEAANNPTVEFQTADMSGEFSAIETRLAALETAPSPEIDPEALTALKSAQDDGFEWPDTSDLEARISGLEAQAELLAKPSAEIEALEDRLVVLETKVETSVDSAATNSALSAAVPNELIDRLKTLEANVDTVRDAKAASAVDAEKIAALEARLSALENRPPPMPVVERVSILAFPKAQLISAVEDNMKGGVIKKTLSRHIRVKGTDDPLTLIDGIEVDLSEGRLKAAAEKFERLPSPVRSAGQAWYESVKASL